MKLPANWKTSLAGVISAASALVLFLQTDHYATLPGWAIGIATFANIGGLAGIGLSAKDYNVSGGTTGQPSTPEAVAAANVEPSHEHPPVAKP